MALRCSGMIITQIKLVLQHGTICKQRIQTAKDFWVILDQILVSKGEKYLRKIRLYLLHCFYTGEVYTLKLKYNSNYCHIWNDISYVFQNTSGHLPVIQATCFTKEQNVPHTPFIWVDHRFAKNICLQLFQPPNTTTITMCLDH